MEDAEEEREREEREDARLQWRRMQRRILSHRSRGL